MSYATHTIRPTEPAPTGPLRVHSAQARQEAFGEVVRRHREARGWSKQRLGDELSWPGPEIGYVESAQRGTSLRSAYFLADALGVSLLLLLADVEALLMESTP